MKSLCKIILAVALVAASVPSLAEEHGDKSARPSANKAEEDDDDDFDDVVYCIALPDYEAPNQRWSVVLASSYICFREGFKVASK